MRDLVRHRRAVAALPWLAQASRHRHLATRGGGQVSALCLSLPALVTSSGVLALVCFFIFEAACGIYFPSMGIIKSKYVRALCAPTRACEAGGC